MITRGGIEVVRAGPLTTVQDLGRPGYAHLGVPRSGALDQPALRRANALVGNPAGAAGLEITFTGCTLRFTAPATIALTGAPARLRVGGVEADFGAAVLVPAGAVVVVGRATAGVRSYLAVAGGVAPDPVLGSRSTDTLSGLGPPRLTDGATLPIGAARRPVAVIRGRLPRVAGVSRRDLPDHGDLARPIQAAPPGDPPHGEGITLRVTLGPRADWFTGDAIDTLLLSSYTVSPMSNRVGARLAGPALTRAEVGELPSEGIVLGAVQVPADGQPLVFLADHPTTGGYPVVAVVDPADLPALAQARPGTSVRFHGPQR